MIVQMGHISGSFGYTNAVKIIAGGKYILSGKGLNGKASGKGETVTVRKLMSYIEEQLPEITKKYRQEVQYPVVDSKGMDFPLSSGKL
ncbi:MAG: hypothetical protein P9L97_12290 [Candidatus Tenebribacter davisii]|jgi:hypothetical protein|nr:hypothetical protein [Candidatus Tenebribacter davisii]